jgi:hypothetical protein
VSQERKKAVSRRAKSAPRSLAISQRGIYTGSDFASFMSALMSDIIESRIDPGVANAACNAGGKLLKVVEMQHRYGEKTTSGQKRVLTLAPMDAKAETIQ